MQHASLNSKRWYDFQSILTILPCFTFVQVLYLDKKVKRTLVKEKAPHFFIFYVFFIKDAIYVILLDHK